MKTLPWLAGIALLAACFGAAAQGTAKKSVDTPLPDLQAGKWKLNMNYRGRASVEEMCGDPIEGMRREVKEYATNKWGCTMSTSAVGPRNVLVVYDCPSDRSPDGRPVSQGRSEISVVSPSPQSFRAEMKSTVHPGYVMEGTRIGDCR